MMELTAPAAPETYGFTSARLADLQQPKYAVRPGMPRIPSAATMRGERRIKLAHAFSFEMAYSASEQT
jgi:hypothetical protein